MSALEFYPPLPVPPSREEMEQAILQWCAGYLDEARPDIVLLDLGTRIIEWRAETRVAGRSGEEK